jgi:Glyoxalase-like domain
MGRPASSRFSCRSARRRQVHDERRAPHSHYHEEIERLTGLGATTVTETKLPEVRWTTLADREGNEFDLVTWQPA